MVFIIYLVKNVKTIVLLLIFICGCQTDADWFRGQTVESIKVRSYDYELRYEQLKYDDMGFCTSRDMEKIIEIRFELVTCWLAFRLNPETGGISGRAYDEIGKKVGILPSSPTSLIN